MPDIRIDPQTARRVRLTELAEQCMDIHHDDVAAALDGAEVPRYALLTSEGTPESSYRDNPDLSIYDELSALGEAIAGTLEDGWPPLSVTDLDTGEEVGYTVRIDFEEAESDG